MSPESPRAGRSPFLPLFTPFYPEPTPSSSQMITIVVVGGGPAGVNVIRGLTAALNPSRHRIILITSRPQYVNLLGSLRLMIVEGTPIDTVFMPYDKLFGDFPGEVKVATVVSIEETRGKLGGTVMTSTGDAVPYDVIVLATGSIWEGMPAFPNDIKEYHAHVDAWREKFQKAQNIVIAGGGPVGIETAGEIKDAFPSKKVTIVQGDRLLLNDVYPDKFRISIERRLRERGVDIIFNDAIKGNPPDDKPVKTREGRTLDCDLLVTSRGGGANTSYMKFLQPSPLTERGYIKVLPTLEVLYHPGMFALGDIVDWPEVKQLAKINRGHAAIVIANVVSYVNNEPLSRFYRGTTEIMAVSIGKNGGVSYLGFLWGFMFGNYFTRYVKAKDLLVPQVKRTLGLA